MKRTNLLFAVIALAAGVAWADQPVSETRSAAPDARVAVEIVSGSIRVTGWDRNEVAVTGTIGDDVDALEISGSDQSISIELDVPDGWGHRSRDIDADLEISLPRGAQLAVETVSADITAMELDGVVEMGSVSGSIELTGRPSQAEVETVSGDIRVEGEQTAVSAETVSGDIVLHGVAESIEAASVSGRVQISATEIDRADLESVSGSIEFAGGLRTSARLQVENHSGVVTLELPADTSATWEVETFSGQINNDFGPEASRTNEYAPGQWLKFTTGSGEARISVESFSGKVWLKKQ